MKKNRKINKLIIFIIFEFIFFILATPFFIFYGPFNNIKQMMVGASMTTLNHQYIAKMFLPEKRIQSILEKNQINLNEQKYLNIIEKNIKNKKSSKDLVEKYLIESKRFKGIALVVNDPNKIKVGYSSKLKVEGETTSNIANNYGALAAINGGGFVYNKQNGSWISNGAIPSGFLISDSKVIYNSEKLGAKIDIMAFTKEGVLLIGKHSLKELRNMNVRDAISFGPALVVNGKGTIIKGDGGWGIAPRTAIGQKKDGTVVFIVIDGRQSFSYGATLKDVQDIMLKLGVFNGTNLDGGASSTMYFKGKVLNNPCDPLGERTVPSIIYVEH